MIFAWCSISVSKISSPGLRNFLEIELARKLNPSVAPLVKIILSCDLDPINLLTFNLISSNFKKKIETEK